MIERIEHLHEIGKLLATFETVEETFDQALQIATQTLRLHSAIVLEVEGGHSKIIMWPTTRQSTAEMAAAKAHAQSAYEYLSGSAEPSEPSVEAGKTELPKWAGPDEVEPAQRFIVIPLVAGRRPVFGVLQIEAAAPLDETDLVFVNAIANQLSLALERDRAWRRDIRQRAAAEALSQRYEALVDNLDHAFVWEADAGTLEMTYVSERAEHLLGYPRHQWLEAAQGGAGVRAAMSRATAEGTDQRCDHRCVARDGRVRWFHTRVHAIETDTGPRLLGLSLDITPWKEAEARVAQHLAERERAEEEQRFLVEAGKELGARLGSPATIELVCRLALGRLGDLCLVDVVDEGGTMRRAAWAHVDPAKEGALAEVFAHDSALAPEHPVCRVVRTGVSERVSHVDDAWLRAFAMSDRHLELMMGRPIRSAVTVPLTLAERRLGALTVLFAESGRRHDDGHLALAEELAQRAAFALENGRLYERAREAVQLREQLLAVVSHDLRGPLATILTGLDLLETDAHDEDEVRQFALRTRRAAGQMRRLIEDLLDFASIDAGQLSISAAPFDPEPLLSDAVGTFASVARDAGIALTDESPGPVPSACGDRERVLQVLSNLLSNAIKVLPRGGRVALRAEPRDGEVVFSVSDNGPGIDPEDLRQVFERYWRSSQKRYRGAGLGLAIARGIVEAHGGRIWADSEVGVGTTFYFTLPAVDRSDSPVA